MRAFNIRLILGVIVASLFISSCSSTNEFASREKFLQSAIENRVENCDSLYALYSFTSYADIGVYSLSEESQIANANLVKKYALEVLAVSKLNNHFNKTEYLKELENVIQEIDRTDLPDTELESLGKRYFPECGYFLTVEVLNDPLEQETRKQETQPVNTPAFDGNREACRIYFETYNQAMQLPFGSPKLSYILRDGYSRAMQYADADLALNFRILLDRSVPNSSDVIFDIAERCDQYR